MNDKLKEANLLNKEINDIKYFLSALDVGELWRENSNVTAYIEKTVETKTTYKIFGRRFYGCGAHEINIDVPTAMIPNIVIMAKALLQQKEIEYKNLFNHETGI